MKSLLLAFCWPSDGTFLFQESEHNVCCALNLRRSDLLLMPLPMFELIHLGAYNIELLVTYIRVMSFLDLDLIMSKQVKPARGLYYKTFYGRNLLIFVIS